MNSPAILPRILGNVYHQDILKDSTFDGGLPQSRRSSTDEAIHMNIALTKAEAEKACHDFSVLVHQRPSEDLQDIRRHRKLSSEMQDATKQGFVESVMHRISPMASPILAVKRLLNMQPKPSDVPNCWGE